MSEVTLTQLLGRLTGAVKPADSFIFTEACSMEICRPNPCEQSPGNIVEISDPNCASAALTIAALGSGDTTSYGITGFIHLPGFFVPLFPTSDSQAKSSVMAKTSTVSRAGENSWRQEAVLDLKVK